MIAALLAIALEIAASTPTPKATVTPARARPGDVLLLEVRGSRERPTAEVAGRALELFSTAPGRWRAFAGLPVETEPGPHVAAIRLPRAGADPLPIDVPFEVVDPGWTERVLAVPPEFTAEKPTEVATRVEEDRAAFLAAFAQAPSPPLFSRPFAWPRRGRVTGRFGDRRTFNGETQGQHYGTDLPGRVGAPITAANDGEVALVRDAWASGLSVVLFHGAGVYTVYFHLSAAEVAEGQRVRRGQRIGALGASGRASGPHLHWGARIGDLYVDPEALLRLTRSWPRAPAR